MFVAELGQKSIFGLLGLFFSCKMCENMYARKIREAKNMANKGGRPTKYKPEYAEMAKFVIEDSGFSMYKLAKLFDVPRSIIYRWMEKHKAFSDGIKSGRRTYEGLKIHRSLVKKAVGFYYTEKTKEPDKNGKTYIDFNKATNPPCAFTEFATCPLPPRENILPVKILAGEKINEHFGHH